MSEGTDPPISRFTRLDEVHSAFHDCVCYLAVDSATGVQVFWFEISTTCVPMDVLDRGEAKFLELKCISCPHLLQVLEVIRQPGLFVVVTEATQSPLVYDYIKSIESRPRITTIVKWFKLACLATKAMHDLDLMHGGFSLRVCHIKPSTGSLKMRLPLVSLLLGQTSNAHIRMNIDAYRAPERLAGIQAKSNDIWSLGISLLGLVTDTTPYAECRTPIDLLRALTEYRRPASLQQVTDAEAADLISKCLSKPEMRPTIDEVLSHPLLSPVERVTAGEGTRVMEEFISLK